MPQQLCYCFEGRRESSATDDAIDEPLALGMKTREVRGVATGSELSTETETDASETSSALRGGQNRAHVHAVVSVAEDGLGVDAYAEKLRRMSAMEEESTLSGSTDSQSDDTDDAKR